VNSYALNWHGKKEAKKEAFSPSKQNVNFTTQNLLINADNLDALKAMKKEYASKIDLIYIDPPYNTKNHKFIYKDKFDTHSSWLNFIYPRVILACAMLKEDGVIFISIDDNEVAQLKLVCDEIFGESNFMAQLIWQKKKKPSFLHTKVAKMSEYILCYAKNIKLAPMLSIESSGEDKPHPLNFRNNPLQELLFASKSVSFSSKVFSGEKGTIIKASDMSKKNVELFLLDDVEIKDGVNVKSFRMRGHWRYSQNTLNKLIEEGALLRVAKIPFRVNYMKKETKAKLMRNMLTKDSYNMATYEEATSEITELFGFEAFSQPKPVELIKTLIKSVTYKKKEALVLDFFAGSGTTAEAVMKLNLEDNGKRKFILIQSNEKINKNFSSLKNSHNTIYKIMKNRVELSQKKYNLENFSFKEINL